MVSEKCCLLFCSIYTFYSVPCYVLYVKFHVFYLRRRFTKQQVRRVKLFGLPTTITVPPFAKVENYSKGKNVEEPLDKDKLPIPNLPEDLLWMQVQGGSKMRNLLELALKEYGKGKDVLWTGSGAAVGKVISCAEILKRNFKNVHQFNKIQYRRCEEYWDPKLEGLDQLVVMRDVPMMHILLTHEPVNTDLPGYQDPKKEFKPRGNGRQNRPKKQPTKPKISPEIEKAGLVYNGGKPKKNVQKKPN